MTCIDVFCMSEKEMVEYHCAAVLFLFLSNVLFDFVVFFVVVFLTAPGNNHLKALAIRE